MHCPFLTEAHANSVVKVTGTRFAGEGATGRSCGDRVAASVGTEQMCFRDVYMLLPVTHADLAIMYFPFAIVQAPAAQKLQFV